ncbi:MAG: hypothetical protein QOF21_2139 [Actinomycetota bacterium]|jgi:hypothetical protein
MSDDTKPAQERRDRTVRVIAAALVFGFGFGAGVVTLRVLSSNGGSMALSPTGLTVTVNAPPIQS